MRALIILNGECNDSTYLFNVSKKYDKVICADGGYKHALKAHIKADVVVGDFDSSQVPENEKIIRYPKEKNLTDGEIAIECAKKMGADRISLACALGGRCDHLLFNIMLLLKEENVDIVEKQCDIFPAKEINIISNCKGKTLSIVPFEKCLIELDGFKYPMHGETQPGSTLTISNIVENDTAKIKVKKGKCLIIINHTI